MTGVGEECIGKVAFLVYDTDKVSVIVVEGCRWFLGKALGAAERHVLDNNCASSTSISASLKEVMTHLQPDDEQPTHRYFLHK